MFLTVTPGIISKPYNDGFKKYHQLVLSILKEFGFGQRVIETRINTEVADLIAQVKDLKGEPFDPRCLVTRSVANVICSILFGHRFERSDHTSDDIMAAVRNFVEGARSAIKVNFFPPMRYIPSIRRRLAEAVNAHENFLRLLNVLISRSLSVEETEVSFVSRFCELEGPNCDREGLLYIVKDLVMAGTETSATTLRWMMALAANHQDFQRRMQQEIDSAIASHRLASLDDRSNLPLVEAFILEVMRYRTLVPSIARLTTRDTQVYGFHIPANTMASIRGVHVGGSGGSCLQFGPGGIFQGSRGG